MALFYECMPKCARKLLDTADIVRDAIFRQLADVQAPSEDLEHKKAASGKAASYSCFDRPQSVTE